VWIFYLGQELTQLALMAEYGQLTEATLRQRAAQFKKKLYDTNLVLKTKRLRPEPFTAGSFWKGLHDFGITRGLYALQAPPNDLRAVMEGHYLR